MDASKITKLASYLTAARINYIPHVYLAQELFPSTKDPDEDEIIEVIKMPFQRAYDLFISGEELTTSFTFVAFLMAKQKLGI